MTGYQGDPERDAEAMRGGYYHTGDVATCDDDGYITYVGRTDDVFKASDYRISPFELESVLIEHAAVAEAAVVPSPDPLRLAVPKAYVLLAAGADARTRSWRGTSCAFARDAGSRLQADPPGRVRRPAQDHLGQDPPGRAPRPGIRPAAAPGAARNSGKRTSPGRRACVLAGDVR